VRKRVRKIWLARAAGEVVGEGRADAYEAWVGE
jgi:hypothetical protein